VVVSVESEQRVDVSGQEGREQQASLRNPSSHPPSLGPSNAISRSIGEGFIFLFSGISLSRGVGWCVEANLIYITNGQNFQLVIQLKVKKEREE
jgi:hypothetical protein